MSTLYGQKVDVVTVRAVTAVLSTVLLQQLEHYQIELRESRVSREDFRSRSRGGGWCGLSGRCKKMEDRFVSLSFSTYGNIYVV
jgi:hypothetical protein